MARPTSLRNIRQFEVYWINLDPTVGHEIQKTRPCVVITSNEMNELLGTVIVAPVTSTLRNLPFRIDVKLLDKKGQVALDQMRAIDKSRIINKITEIEDSAAQEILQKLSEMFAE